MKLEREKVIHVADASSISLIKCWMSFTYLIVSEIKAYIELIRVVKKKPTTQQTKHPKTNNNKKNKSPNKQKKTQPIVNF